MGYEIFDPKVDKPLHLASAQEAQLAYGWFIQSLPHRLEELQRLVAADGIRLDFSSNSLDTIHEWFVRLVLEERSLGNQRPSPELFSVCNDVAVYLAEFLMRQRKVRWSLLQGDPAALSFQRPVVTGFETKNPDFHIDFDYLICQYAHRILETGAGEDRLFRAMIERALNIR